MTTNETNQPQQQPQQQQQQQQQQGFKVLLPEAGPVATTSPSSKEVHRNAGNKDGGGGGGGGECHDDEEHETEDELLSVLTPDVVRAVRWSMTLLLVLLIPAAWLTWMTATQYGLVLGAGWLVVGSFFLALVYLVQTKVGKRRGGVYPFLDVAEIMTVLVQEYRDFVDDWQHHERLLLTQTAAQDSYPHDDSFTNNNNNNQTVVAPEEEDARENVPRRTIKSFLFRAVVQPFLPRMMRRRRRQERRSHATATGSYQAPIPVAVEMV